MITVKSDVGKGACFDVYLPLCDTDGLAAVDLVPPKEIQQSGLFILIVDDEPMIRDLTSDILTSNGHSVLLAADGKEAVSHYQNNWQQRDLVVLDMIMPEMNGLDALKVMKAINPEVRVILCSGYSLSEHLIEAEQHGLFGYLEKPYQAKELLSSLTPIIQRQMRIVAGSNRPSARVGGERLCSPTLSRPRCSRIF
jgi:two-component system cell cycle sensor histidine kinase/response regulator CckA